MVLLEGEKIFRYKEAFRAMQNDMIWGVAFLKTSWVNQFSFFVVQLMKDMILPDAPNLFPITIIGP